MTMISPPPHHDIYSIEDLAQLIGDLRAVNPRARIGVKLVAGAEIGTIAAGRGQGAGRLRHRQRARRRHRRLAAELDQDAGCRGSSAWPSRTRSWSHRLRDRVALRTDGGLQTGRDVVVAAMLGRRAVRFGTAALVAIGCDMARQCHLDTCPTGIATQREDLRAKFTGTPEGGSPSSLPSPRTSAGSCRARPPLARRGDRRADLLRGTDAVLHLTAARRAGLVAGRRGPPKDRPRWAGRPADAASRPRARRHRGA